MSHFYGYLTGNRGTATRCGSKNSGIRSIIRSWDNEVKMELFNNCDDKDILNIQIPKGLKTIINGKVRRLR